MLYEYVLTPLRDSSPHPRRRHLTCPIDRLFLPPFSSTKGSLSLDAAPSSPDPTANLCLLLPSCPALTPKKKWIFDK